ncbi:MAG: hypothetical protein ACD_58C00224G0001 [uncultured bacterium]|nr:MAG: hypothetical protein ACD_58C00224G0001 [uncultured bacterium]
MLKKILFISSFTLLIANFTPALAQKSSDIGISPSLIEVNVEKGQTVNKQIHIINNGQLNISVEASASQFSYVKRKSENTKLIKVDPNDWISFSEPEFILEAGQAKTIDFQIKIPDKVEPGGYDFLVGFNQVNDLKENSINIINRINTILLVNIKGDINYDAKINSFQTNKKIYYTLNPGVQFNYNLFNNSDTFILPQGEIVISNIFGKVTSKINANSETSRFLVGEEKEILSNFTPKFLFGRYKAELNLNYANGLVVVDNCVFWVIPLRELALLLVIIVMIFTKFKKKNKK